ncbi:MAG: S1 RNA-binding domain-containing protein, partial [Pseudomonadota bacterium]
IQSFNKGDTVTARVLDVDAEKERISLGIKQVGGDPIADNTAAKRGAIVTCKVTEVASGGIEVEFGDPAVKAFIRRSDLSRDRSEQRPERFAVGDKIDAKVTQVDKSSRRVSVSIKALEISEEQEAVAQYGSADSGASLGDILGAALATSDDAETAEAADEKPAKKKATKKKKADAGDKA